MRLLKLIGLFFLFYFIRRFIQMYKVMSELQKQQGNLQKPFNPPPAQPAQKNADIIEADFKVVDR